MYTTHCVKEMRAASAITIVWEIYRRRTAEFWIILIEYAPPAVDAPVRASLPDPIQ